MHWQHFGLLRKNPSTQRSVTEHSKRHFLVQKLDEKEKGKKLGLISIVMWRWRQRCGETRAHETCSAHLGNGQNCPKSQPNASVHSQLSFPQKMALPAPLGTRKWSLLSLQIQELSFQKQTLRQWGGRHSWNHVLERQRRNRWAWAEPNSLHPRIPQTASHLGSLQDRQVYKVTTPVPLHQLCIYPHFRGEFLKQRPPWEKGSHCHSCGLKDVPLSSDTAASLGLNSDLVWCPLRYFPRL